MNYTVLLYIMYINLTYCYIYTSYMVCLFYAVKSTYANIVGLIEPWLIFVVQLACTKKLASSLSSIMQDFKILYNIDSLL